MRLFRRREAGGSATGWVRILGGGWAHAVATGVLAAYCACGLLLLRVPSNDDADYWEHLAAFGSFAQSVASPRNPYIASGGPTHLFTPYSLLWGAVARASGSHPFWLLPLIGAVNMVLFGASCRRMA